MSGRRSTCTRRRRWVTAVLLPHLSVTRVWEPAAGSGKMVAVLRQAGFDVVGSNVTQGADFLQHAPPPGTGAIVTNPPYAGAGVYRGRRCWRADSQRLNRARARNYRRAISVATFGKTLHQEVSRPHPRLQSAERMFDRLAMLAHCLRVFVEALLYGLQYMLMFPAGDASLRAGRAVMLERAVAAHIRPIAPQLLPVPLVCVLQLFASPTAIHILLAEIDKVLLAEAPLCLDL
jgi:hypothetical protein